MGEMQLHVLEESVKFNEETVMTPFRLYRNHPDAIIPRYATPGSACFDLHSIEAGRVCVDEPNAFRTGLCVEIPKGKVMLIFSRSGHGFKDNLRLSNCTGVIDSDYRGEIKIKIAKDTEIYNNGIFFVKKGDRIAQAMIVDCPQVEFIEVSSKEELSETARGDDGFGSTGC